MPRSRLAKPPDAVRSTAKADLTGIVLNPGDAQPSQIDEALGQLRSGYPGLPVLVLNPKAKQPQMKGQMVIKRDGVLQVTSPTAQPWIDSNLALVRLDQAFRPAQTPLYEFQWDLSDAVQTGARPRSGGLRTRRGRGRSASGVDVILDLDTSTSEQGLRIRTLPPGPSLTRSSVIWSFLPEGSGMSAKRKPTLA